MKIFQTKLHLLSVCSCLLFSAAAFAVDTDGDGMQDNSNYEYEDSFESGSFTKLPWVLSGDGNWTVYSESLVANRIDGSYMASSPALGGGILTTKIASMALTVTLNNAGNVLFYWKGACQEVCGLVFYIDGVIKVNYLSDQSWNERSVAIGAGQHTLLWEFRSAANNTAGKIRVDKIRVGTYAPIDTDDDNDGVLDVNDAFPLDATESTDTDSDGIGNNADSDDDNDGVPDAVDVAPLDNSNTDEITLPLDGIYKGSTLYNGQVSQ